MAAGTIVNGSSKAKEEFNSEQHFKDDDAFLDAEDMDSEVPAASAAETSTAEMNKWPGWPGENVFRLVVPVLKVGGIIGRKGELIKKLCEETRARVRVLEGADGTNDRIVLVTAKEEPDLEIPPAVDAVLRIFKGVNGLEDGVDSAVAASTVCSARLLVASSQATSLIGKQGALIKSIQESTSAIIRVLSRDELSHYANDEERVVDIYGESLKVIKALEAVLGHLRKFLVDHSILPQFEKIVKNPVFQERETEEWSSREQAGMGNDYDIPVKRNSSYYDSDPPLDSHLQRSNLSLYGQDPPLDSHLQRSNLSLYGQDPPLDSHLQRSNLSLYGQDPSLPGLRSSASGLSRSAGTFVTQITQTMQIPLSYAEDIIGVGGGNIAYIRRTSGAVLTVQETRGTPDEITVEIKGGTSQVQIAQQLVQEFIAGHKEPVQSSYGSRDPTGLRSSYSHLGRSDYSSSSYPASSLGGYGGSTGMGGYGSYRF